MRTRLSTIALLLALVAPAAAQQPVFPTADPVIRRMWDEGMTDRSNLPRMAQALLDSIGPRLSASPGHYQAIDWAQAQLQGWGVTARKEQYGTWMAWERGYTRLELIAPRVRSLEGTILAWSGAPLRPVEGDVVIPPAFATAAEAATWVATTRGKYVALSFPEPTCRPDENWERLATPESVTKMQAERTAARQAFARGLQPGGGARALANAIESAGAAGVLNLYWSGGWGANKVMSAGGDRIPQLDLSCEDYGLLYRLASNGQGPRVRLTADAQPLADEPMFNVIAELQGTELPDEYVVLSAHLDCWHGASGATDNGTGTIMMLEAMRILKAAYPQPDADHPGGPLGRRGAGPDRLRRRSRRTTRR